MNAKNYNDLASSPAVPAGQIAQACGKSLPGNARPEVS